MPQVIITAAAKTKTKIREAENGHFPDFEQEAENGDMQKTKQWYRYAERN